MPKSATPVRRFRGTRNIDGPTGFTNRKRAVRAFDTLQHYQFWPRPRKKSQAIDESTAQDLISDIAHYCDMKHLDFDEILASAIARWQEER